MRSLKLLASEELKPAVFLSSGQRVRLKSPISIQAPVVESAMEASSLKNSGLSALSVGA